jgi:hypothetical protein
VAERLPNFLIVGAAKCGTTSLADWLRAHPDVWIPPEKELMFFDRDDRADDTAWYRACFAGAGDEAAVGEASPTYMTSPKALDRIAALLPGVRVIVMLRQPVDRAYSHYWHWREREGEGRSFAKVVAFELQPGRAEETGRWDAKHPERYSYLAHGNYCRQLDWLAERFPAEAQHVILFDDFRRDPAAVYRAVCRFLGVDDEPVPEDVGAVSNPTVRFEPEWLWRAFIRVRLGRWIPDRAGAAIYHRMKRTGYPPMDPAIRERLLAHYAPEREALAGRLGRDLGAWAS